MNLTPQWRFPLEEVGHDVKHGSEIGPPNAPDTTIMEWAGKHDYVVFTHEWITEPCFMPPEQPHRVLFKPDARMCAQVRWRHPSSRRCRKQSRNYRTELWLRLT